MELQRNLECERNSQFEKHQMTWFHLHLSEFNVNFVCFFADRKAHRNGIKKPQRKIHESTLGVSAFCDSLGFDERTQSILFALFNHCRFFRFRWMQNSCAIKDLPAKEMLALLRHANVTKKNWRVAPIDQNPSNCKRLQYATFWFYSVWNHETRIKVFQHL